MLQPKINASWSAADRANGNVEPLPPSLRGGARDKVIDSLVAKGLAARTGEYVLITDAGYAAIGKTPPKGVQNVDTPRAYQDPPTIAMRPGTKLAMVVECLRRPDGATVAQMMLETGWQAHSIRGAISGTIKKSSLDSKCRLTSSKAASEPTASPDQIWS